MMVTSTVELIQTGMKYDTQSIFTFLKNQRAQAVGSRYLNLSNLNSDYDYMLVHTPELEQRLEELGMFCAISEEKVADNAVDNPDYNIDCCTHSIWIHRGDKKIDVQLIKSNTHFNIKMEVYNLIRNYDICKGLDKEIRKIIFINMLNNLYNDFFEE